MTNLIEAMLEADACESEYQQATWSGRCAILKQFYTSKTPEIIRKAKRNSRVWGIDPYAFDWQFNQNEQALWGAIRRASLVIYPEFPVLDRFVDFGNPFLRIALEADSQRYHNRQKDIVRDSKLLDAGWKVFRTSYQESIAPFVPLGDIAEMIRSGRDQEASQAMHDWLLETSDGVVDAIDFLYFMSRGEREARMQKYPPYLPLAIRTLKKHRLVEFPFPTI